LKNEENEKIVIKSEKKGLITEVEKERDIAKGNLKN